MNVYTVVPSIAALHAGAAYLMRSPVVVKGTLVLSVSTSALYVILGSATNRFNKPESTEKETDESRDEELVKKTAEKKIY